jgi:SlyX protein
MSGALEARIVELEIKLSFADDLLEQLNAQLARQQTQIDWLARELQELKRRDGAGPAGAPAGPERPPHY